MPFRIGSIGIRVLANRLYVTTLVTAWMTQLWPFDCTISSSKKMPTMTARTLMGRQKLVVLVKVQNIAVRLAMLFVVRLPGILK